eukprot:scaffold2607_cov254-Pinguiococcus_pyrenoidosus.AAC.11
MDQLVAYRDLPKKRLPGLLRKKALVVASKRLSSAERYCAFQNFRAPPTPESPSLDPARLHERAQLRQERQKQREGTADPACTFSPKVNTRARRASAEASSSPQDNRFDKLYEDAQRRRQTQETRREEAAQSREKACTFSPKVKGSRSRGPKSPDSTFQVRTCMRRKRGSHDERDRAWR